MVEFTINQKNFLEGLKIASFGVAKRSPTPALERIQILTEDDRVVLVGTNGVFSVTATVIADVTEPGKMMADKDLLESVSTLRGDVWFRANDTNDTNMLQDNLGTFEFTKEPYELVQEIPQNGDHVVVLDGTTFFDGLRKTIYARAKSEVRPLLNGVNIVAKDGTITLCATDTRRVAKTIFVTNQFIDANWIIDGTVANALMVVGQNFSNFNQLNDEEIEMLKAQEYDLDRVVDDDYNTEIIIEQADNYLIFKLPKVTFATRIMEGDFPDIDQLVDKLPQEKIAVLNRKELLNATKKVNVINKVTENKDTKFQFVPGMPLTITAKTDGKKVDIQVPCFVSRSFSAMFNSHLLADMLKTIDEEEVEILGGGTTILIRTNDATHVLMGLIVKEV